MAKPSYNIDEAKAKLSEILVAVQAGQEITIMNRGEPVARIVSIEKSRKLVRLGFLKGRLKLKPGWEAPLEGFRDFQ